MGREKDRATEGGREREIWDRNEREEGEGGRERTRLAGPHDKGER